MADQDNSGDRYRPLDEVDVQRVCRESLGAQDGLRGSRSDPHRGLQRHTYSP